MMKLMFVAILPLVFCAPALEKRFFLDSLTGFDTSVLKCDVQLMVDTLGSDPSEAACETECHKLITDGTVFSYGCPLICHGFSAAIHLFHIVPESTDPTGGPCAAKSTVSK